MLINWNELRLRFATRDVYCLLLSFLHLYCSWLSLKSLLALFNSLQEILLRWPTMVTLEQLRRDTDQLAAVDALAGTLVNAVRYSFEQALVPGPSQSPRSGHRLPGGSSSTPQRKVTEYQRVANQGTRKTKLSVATPSLFSQCSSSCRSNSQKRKQSDVQAKSTTYVRDIVLLSKEFRSENGTHDLLEGRSLARLG